MAFGLNVTSCGVQREIREEQGCLQYDFFLPLDDSDKLLLMEKWTDREAQAVHMTQPHMAKLREVKARFVQDVVMETYDL